MITDTPRDLDELEERLSRPSKSVLQAFSELDGDLILLGAGGKMGPTLARMARRAADETGRPRRIVAVSRFTDPRIRERLNACGVETVACDLLDQVEVDRLPEAANVIYMTGVKFGTSQNPARSWAMNCLSPALVCRKYSSSRIAAFSSGNVYARVPANSTGSRETDSLEPFGEYAMTVLGRERIFQHFSSELQIPVVLLRLNYATELRYGVLVDIARAVFQGDAVDLSVPTVNVIWQGDANAMTLAALTHAATPANVINIAGPEILRVREIAEVCARITGKTARFVNEEGPLAYLNDGTRGHELLGTVSVTAEELIRWTAEWVMRGGESLDKPTHFQATDGKF